VKENFKRRPPQQPQRYSNVLRTPFQQRGGRGRGRGGRPFNREARAESHIESSIQQASIQAGSAPEEMRIVETIYASMSEQMLRKQLLTQLLTPALEDVDITARSPHDSARSPEFTETKTPDALRLDPQIPERTAPLRRLALQQHLLRQDAADQVISGRIDDDTPQRSDNTAEIQSEKSLYTSSEDTLGTKALNESTAKSEQNRPSKISKKKPDASAKPDVTKDVASPEQRGQGTSRRIRQNEEEERFIEGELDPRPRRRDVWHERRAQEIIPVELPSIFSLTTISAAGALQVSTAQVVSENHSKKRTDTRTNKRADKRQKPVQQTNQTSVQTPSQLAPHLVSYPPHPSRVRIHTGVAAILNQQNLLERHVRLVCAVSGGVDSLVLLDTLAMLAVRHGMDIIIAHCNHQLRGTASEQDMEFVLETARRYGFAVYAASVDVARYAEKQRLSVETAARALRYQFLEFVAYKTRAHAVCTAHTMNDSVETFMMNLLRGSGLSGLAGIALARPFGQVSTLVRPLLDIRKDDLVAYAHASGLVWREDESNALTQFKRNKIRHELLPMIEAEYTPAFMDVVQRTSHLLREADAVIGKTAERALVPILGNAETYHPHYLALNVEPLTGHSAFMQGELIHRAVQAKFEAQFGSLILSFDAVERVRSLVNAPLNTKADMNKYLYAIRDRDSILIAPKLPIHNLNVRVEKNKEYDIGGWRIILREIDRRQVQFTADPSVEHFDSSLLPYRLTLRSWQPGDTFQPFGMKGHTVKVSDYLTNSKASFIQRQHALVLAAGEEIVWLCGMRMAEKFRIHDHTKRVLRVEYRPKKQPPPQQFQVPVQSQSELALR
jgi:tRNA(Ile)-lysidine synthase